MLSLTLWVSLLLGCVNCDLQRDMDFRNSGILVLFQKVYFFPLACAMSQLTHWPAIPCTRAPAGLFPHPLGSRAHGQRSRAPAGFKWPLIHPLGAHGRIDSPAAACALVSRRPGGTVASDGQRPRCRRREAGSVPVARWGRVGPATDVAQTGRYHEQFFIFSN